MNGEEKEIKLVLGMDEHELLSDYFSKYSTFLKELKQRNIYLDSSDRQLTSKSEMFRIRVTEQTIQITHKYDLDSQDGFFQCSQREKEFERVPFADITELVTNLPLEDFYPHLPSSLEVIGEMENRRMVYLWKNFTIELDTTKMPDSTTEFELECETETPDRFQAVIKEVFDEIGITMKFQTQTKYARFLEKLDCLEST